jgi:lysozyme
LFSNRANASNNGASVNTPVDGNGDPILLPDLPYMPIPDVTMPVSPVPAFMYMIRSAENRMVTNDSDRYNRFYGNSTFTDMSDHPVNTGEKKGVPLPASMCRAAGLNPGCVSTAAGAYQIIRPTWDQVRETGAWGDRLPDFSPASQDEAARRLMLESGIVDALESNDFSGALSKASKVWASLPGSTARQGGITVAQASQLFNTGLQVA